MGKSGIRWSDGRKEGETKRAEERIRKEVG